MTQFDEEFLATIGKRHEQIQVENRPADTSQEEEDPVVIENRKRLEKITKWAGDVAVAAQNHGVQPDTTIRDPGNRKEFPAWLITSEWQYLHDTVDLSRTPSPPDLTKMWSGVVLAPNKHLYYFNRSPQLEVVDIDHVITLETRAKLEKWTLLSFDDVRTRSHGYETLELGLADFALRNGLVELTPDPQQQPTRNAQIV